MAEQLKIIIIGPGYPYRNGQSVYLSSLCNQLSSEFKVELINYTLLYPKFLFPGSTQYDESKDRKITFPNKRMLNSLNPLSWIKTAQYINARKPDLIAIDWWHPFFGLCNRGITLWLHKKLKRKVIFITENVISHEANKLDRILTKIGLKNAKCFLALSEAVEKQLYSLFKKKVFRSVLPIYDFYKSAVPDNTKQLKEKFNFQENDIVFLFFGLIRKYKGLDLLIEAFARLRKTNSSVKLLIVGEFYEPSEPYFDLIKKQHIEDAVHIENRYVPDEQVEQYFNASDCVVLPYRSATQSGILSMAYGFRKPVVVTHVGELAALVQVPKTGLVAATPTTEAIYKSMAEFLKLHAAKTPFKENIASYLTEKDEFKKVNNVFREILTFLNKNNPEDKEPKKPVQN